ncbi:glycosyltransferase family 9 protein [Pinirhizobacter soli]|uniref:glycosyltransferase family 9 protein n=1 Tax=Pinirhizobacter soli TaxID=2786953 RepID=UPI00202A703B|nr:glycosyltransferase family 9 protein [Pinirhizobacter soli]
MAVQKALPKRTRRLGDSIHAWAVMQAIPATMALPFEAFVPFAPIFENQELPVIANPKGSRWVARPGGHWPGPEHGLHVRDSMAQAAGAERDRLGAMLKPLPGLIRGGKYVVVCPNSAIGYKEWPETSWSHVIEESLGLGLDVVIASGPARERIRAPHGAEFLDVSVVGLARLLTRASCLVAPDSGPVHLADALGVPAVGLYGATSTVTYGPYRDKSFCIDMHEELYPQGERYSSARHLPDVDMAMMGIDRVLEAMKRAVASDQDRVRRDLCLGC